LTLVKPNESPADARLKLPGNKGINYQKNFQCYGRNQMKKQNLNVRHAL